MEFDIGTDGGANALSLHDRLIPIRIWSPALPVLTGSIFAFDTETRHFDESERYKLPDLVVCTVSNGQTVDLILWHDVHKYFENLELVNGSKIQYLVFNAAFDIDVLQVPVVYEALIQGRVVDIGMRHRIRSIARDGWYAPKVALATLAMTYLHLPLEKDEEIRLTFERDMVMTAGHLVYACKDAAVTWYIGDRMGTQVQEAMQTQCSYMLSIIERNGCPVDRAVFDKQTLFYRDELQKYAAELRKLGYEPEADKRKPANLLGVLMNEIGLAAPARTPSHVNWFKQLLYIFVMSAYHKTPSQSWSDFVTAFSREYIAAAMEGNKRRALDAKAFDSLFKNIGMDDLFEGAKGYRYTAFMSEYVKSYKDTLDYKAALVMAVHSCEVSGGWQAVTAPVGPVKYTQDHLLALEKMYPSLEFPRTNGDKDGNNKRLKCSKQEMWRLQIMNVKDQFLESKMAYEHAGKMLSTYLNVDKISKDGRMRCRFNPMLRTGRTSASSPNLQNFPKKGGLRNIICAPPGYGLVSIDYSQLELCALAQHCYRTYGKSVMRDAINAGIDLHCYFWATVEGIIQPGVNDYNPLVPGDADRVTTLIAPIKKRPERSWAKCGNFGIKITHYVVSIYVEWNAEVKSLRKSGNLKW